MKARTRGLLGSVIVLAWLAVLASGVATVYARHEARKLFVELQALERERDRLDVEWGQLRIEQGMLATHARVEQLARDRLDMRMPEPDEVVTVSDD